MFSGDLKGTYNHNMDVKGRMSFPTKLRESLGDTFVITKGMDGCLCVYSLESWEKLSDKVKSMPMSKSTRSLQRFLMAGASEVEADKQGRILIPQILREFAGLTKDIVVIGVTTRAEIWDKEKWDVVNSEFDEDDLEEAMSGLDF